MDMKIDCKRIRAEREARAWSQEHLAQVSGLGVRTIQRVESSGVASYESTQAIAAALQLQPRELLVSNEAPLNEPTPRNVNSVDPPPGRFNKTAQLLPSLIIAVGTIGATVTQVQIQGDFRWLSAFILASSIVMGRALHNLLTRLQTGMNLAFYLAAICFATTLAMNYIDGANAAVMIPTMGGFAAVLLASDRECAGRRFKRTSLAGT